MKRERGNDATVPGQQRHLLDTVTRAAENDKGVVRQLVQESGWTTNRDRTKKKNFIHTLQKHCYHSMPSFHPDLTARDSTLYLQLLD